ncbi:MAG: YcjF family protein [Burkholderiales bacterium]|nr:GTPase [Rhodocyclaceae bacterium]MCA3021815.1 GTPase [Rhodocyclaceae bacterium]MCA3054316.1 GTPase [Rhodocyclaceae bacterium]
MNEQERDGVLAIAMMAAFADGNNTDQERAEIRRIADALGAESGANMPLLYQNVLLKKVGVADAAAMVTSGEGRALAYEFAAGVCNADGALSPAEIAFLASLQSALGLAASRAGEVLKQSAAMAAAPLLTSESISASVEPKFASTMTEAELDKMILNYSILNGALELLPQSLASMAIIPLQMKMVYRIGKSHGFELDKGHIKDFLATLGVGLTSQYVEQFGRRLVGGLLGKLAGGVGRMAGSAVTGSAFSFATTYALGQVARRYYANGRTLSADTLKSSFSGMLGEAKQLQTRYLPEIRQKASTIDVTQVMKEVAG